MKNDLFLIAIGAFLLLGNSNAIRANKLPSDEAFLLNESTAYAPDLPAVPQEEDFLCADVNEDGIVNVLDIITLVNYVMEGNPDPFSEEAADVNADGIINVLDIISLVNIIMQVPGIPCGCVAPVLHEGQTYSTVQIGDQCWFRENLNIGTMIEGTIEQSNNGTTEKYCYNNDEANCDIYGGLYEWPEAMQHVTAEGAQGICPEGWHIPSDNEWKILEGAVDSQYPVGDPIWETSNWRGFDAGGNLKEVSFLHWIAPNSGATNESGFTALPAGYRDYWGGYFDNMGVYTTFWTSTPNSETNAWTHELNNNHSDIYRNFYDKEYGYSIRCLKGCWPEPTQSNAGPDQIDIPGTSATLAGNAPTDGTGLWAIVSGTGGTITAPANPASEFQGLAGNEYTLSWTITTQCGSTADTLMISFAASGDFACGDDLEYEGQSYETVLIGNQCWMAENLNVGAMVLSSSGGQLQTNNGSIEKYCHGNNAANCDTYGGLYEWNEAMQYVATEGAQGICPVGWHLPTDTEWKILEGTVDSQYGTGDPQWDLTGVRGFDAGGNLKEAGTAHWTSPNTGAINSSGFTALPGGSRQDNDGTFWVLNMGGYFWTSSQFDASNAWDRGLWYMHPLVIRAYHDKDMGRSVRCLLEACTPQPTPASAGPDQLNVPGTTTNLAANTPIDGEGLWSIASGTGGTIVSPSDPSSQFQGLANHEYVLSWAITTICGSSSDMVTISFASDGTFECGDLLTDVRDGQSYETVQIGYQCWMAENLSVGTMILSDATGSLQTDNGVIEKYCYDNDAAGCTTYGGLYEWNEAMQYSTAEGVQGICPEGWHLPTDQQWSVLNGFLGGTDVAGGKMKTTGNTGEGTGLWLAPNAGATNESGFSGLPGGYREAISGAFKILSQRGYFWSTTQYADIPIYAWNYRLHYYSADLYRSYAGKEDGRSVRCIYDCEPLPSQADAGPDQTIYGTSATLAGNTPSSGTGQWLIINGPGGSIEDPASPDSEFQGLACTTYTLSWNICTSCGCTSDTVLINFVPVTSFVCGDILEDCRDGQSYATVQIGDQCWMAENLNVGVMINSDASGSLQTDNYIIEKFCNENDISNCDTYGGLYEWNEVMGYVEAEGVRGICPYGWHIPADGEWTALTTYLGGTSIAGGKMKSTGTLELGTGLWYGPNTGATNESGFTGLPGGSREPAGSYFTNLHSDGFFWSSSRHFTDLVWYRGLGFNSSAIDRSDSTYGDDGFSVRCLKD